MAPLPQIAAPRLPWERFEVLSLDVFDTTLARRCGSPTVVFDLLEERLVAERGESFRGFARERRAIDPLTRRHVWETRQEEEVTLADLYARLGAHWGPAHGAEEALAALEMAAEKEMLYGIAAARQLVAEARARGKRVLFISDMYLPGEFLAQRLQEAGFDDFDHLFVSSAEGCLKRSGKLFELVAGRLGLDPRRCLHVGDDAEADGRAARRAGWQSIVTPKPLDALARLAPHPLARPAPDPVPPAAALLQGTLLSALVDPPEAGAHDPFWFRFGYASAGPLYHGFLRFILEAVRGRGLTRLFFLSRDGYFLRQLYDAATAGDPSYPESRYLYASRRALNFAAIEKLDPGTEDWLAEGIRLTVGQFFERMGMDPAPFAEHLRRYGFEGPDHTVRTAFEYDALRRLYRELEPAIVAAAREERARYREYLEGELGPPEEPCVLVDVGWNASLQDALRRILATGPSSRPIEGLYLGTYAKARERVVPGTSSHRSYLLTYGEPEATMRTVRAGVALLEFLFAAPETTFLRMGRDADGRLVPEFHHEHENAADLAALAGIHAGVEAFCARLRGLEGWPGLSVDPRLVEAITLRWLVEPTREEARRLAAIHYPDGWGGTFWLSRMADVGGFWDRFPRKQRVKEHFRQSHWRPGYYALLNPLQRWLLRWMHPTLRMDREL